MEMPFFDRFLAIFLNSSYFDTKERSGLSISDFACQFSLSFDIKSKFWPFLAKMGRKFDFSSIFGQKTAVLTLFFRQDFSDKVQDDSFQANCGRD